MKTSLAVLLTATIIYLVQEGHLWLNTLGLEGLNPAFSFTLVGVCSIALLVLMLRDKSRL